jgi:hypothetical protein
MVLGSTLPTQEGNRNQLEPINCSIPDDHIDPRRSAFFMARSVFGDIREATKC